MDTGISGRVALVSGGSAGIGFAIAEQLAAEGVKVLIVGRDAQRAEAARDQLRATAPGPVAMAVADMTTREGVDSAIRATVTAFGEPDIAISNVIGHKVQADADGPPPGFFRTVELSEYANEFRQLVMSALWLSQGTLPGMLARRWGRMINIGSLVAREPNWDLPHILPNTVRPVVAGLLSKLAYRHSGTGVTFNSLLTGSIATDRNRAYFTWLAAERGTTYEEIVAANSSRTPLRRPGEPKEMAALATFLCSRQAGGISGQSIAVGGGSSRHLF